MKNSDVEKAGCCWSLLAAPDLHVPPGEVYTTIEYIQQLYYNTELEMNRVDDETTIGELLDFMEENILSQHA